MKPALRIWVKEGRQWNEVPNGPFPITPAHLIEARKRFDIERKAAKPLHGANHAPQTTARAILHDICPKLSNFDALMIGFAVTSAKVKAEPA